MKNQTLFIKEDIEFNADGNILRGWLYLSKDNKDEPKPVVVMAHGYAGIKEMYLDRYAGKFSKSGISVLVFDYKGFGDSERTPRQEINPWQQIEDYRHAITYASTRPEINEELIGVWGTSYSGGHALVLGATDSRVKCVVSQVPTISGSETAYRRIQGSALSDLLSKFSEDRKNRMNGAEPIYHAVIPEGELNGIYKTKDAIDFYTKGAQMGNNFVNKVTLRSVELSRGYDPGAFISKISPKPVLLRVAENDDITPTDLALKAYEEALQPKKLVMIPGGHFGPYVEHFERSCGEALDWFSTYLLK